jgi:hypothetical protein
MYDANRNETDNVEKMVGQPTLFKVTQPENIIFAHETGCNTNMKKNGHVGGEVYMLPNDNTEFGRTVTATDIHFTRTPKLCAVLLKSKKTAADIPFSWKLGVDITKEVKTGQTQCEIMQNNYAKATSCRADLLVPSKEFGFLAL